MGRRILSLKSWREIPLPFKSGIAGAMGWSRRNDDPGSSWHAAKLNARMIKQSANQIVVQQADKAVFQTMRRPSKCIAPALLRAQLRPDVAAPKS